MDVSSTNNYPEFLCKNCKKTIFAIITPRQTKYNLINLGVKMYPRDMVFDCPLCKEPNVIDRHAFAKILRNIFKQRQGNGHKITR